jgi:DNA-binding transcriptional LysR family regulator
MTLQQLRFLVAVIENGGIGRAATRLRVSQPAVSTALKALEKNLGKALFERRDRGRPVRPTRNALALYRSALEILGRCDLARKQFRGSDPKPSTLRIGVLRTLASEAVGAFVEAFGRRQTVVRLQLWEGAPIQLAEWLRLGRIDAAWTVVDKDALCSRVLWKEPFVLIASPTHRFGKAARKAICLSDLEGEKVVMRTICEMKRGELWPESLRVRVVARAERDELAIKLVAKDVGVAIVPQSLGTRDVIVRRIQDLERSRSIGLRWRQDLSPENVTALVDALSLTSHEA